VDQWALLEKQAEMEDIPEKKKQEAQKKQTAAADAKTWDWADDYSDEARRLKAQRITRELEAGEAAAEEPGPGATPSRRDREDRVRDRHGRFYREERPDRREKPKKAKSRRREDEDDDWDDDFYEEKRRRKAEKAEKERQRQAALAEAGPTPIFLPEFISVSNLAVALGQKVDVFVRQLEELGFEDVSKDNILTGETAALVAQEYGFEPTVDSGEAEDLKPAPPPADPSSLPLRPPVVTIMGHVDHGKTTLLDYLRKSSIVAQEHGGITQHIGAFSVSMSSGKQITFLDTPGHAAFLSMRQRGAYVTDMVILVVAADDSVMPQTLEALKHARTAKVPIIVAINKVDKPEANVDRVKSDLAAHGVEIEDYGGDVQVVPVSGKTGQGMDNLEESILLLSELLDIRAERDGLAEGWVLESTIKPIGRVATVLVKRGTLRPGDYIVAGRVHAKIRSLRNEAGVEVEEATPGTAVEVLGWKEPPDAGDQVLQAPDEGRAKSAVRYRQELKERGEVIVQMAQQEQERREREREREREKALAEAANPRNRRHHNHDPSATTDLENPAEGDNETPADTTKYVTYLVKGDVHGSVEAVTAALLEQGNNEVRAKVLVSAPGQITESDVEHAAISGSAIINFNNTIPSHIKRLAYETGVQIMDHNVIYHLVEEVKEKLAAALPPLVIKKVVGEAEVLQVFPINIKGRKFKNIAGCRIGNGYVRKGSKARVIRGGQNIYEGKSPPSIPKTFFFCMAGGTDRYLPL
jgi:translation initiation factor IF-2